MKSSLYVLGGIVLVVAAHEAHSAAALPNLHDLMKNVVAVQTQVIWDVGNQAQDDRGNPDATKLKTDDWSKIISAGGKVRQVAQPLAQADRIVAAAPGTKLGEQDTPGALGVKEMQAAIEADPGAFRALAQALSASMDQIVQFHRWHGMDPGRTTGRDSAVSFARCAQFRSGTRQHPVAALAGSPLDLRLGDPG